MSACPHDSTICGSKGISFANSSSASVTRDIDSLTDSKSCHYVIKATCDLPTISLTSVGSSASENLAVFYVEYMDADASSVDNTAYVSIVSSSYPAMTTEITWIEDQFAYKEGSLGELRILESGSSSGSYTNYKYIPGSYVESEIDWFNSEVSAYVTLVSAYSSTSGTLAVWETYVSAISDEMDDGDITTSFMSDISVPEAPDAFSGYFLDPSASSSSLLVYTGYGMPTAGQITLDSNYGTVKHFGVFGQGSDSS